MPCTLYLDLEARSPSDLKKVGVHKYAEDPGTEILLFSYKLGEKSTKLWFKGEKLPQEIIDHVNSGGIVIAHNAEFDRVIWNTIGERSHGFPKIKSIQFRDTMARAGAMSLPRSLNNCAVALGVDIGKDKEGTQLMREMCSPTGTTINGDPIWREDPESIKRLGEYAKRDVDVLYRIDQKLRPLRNSEQRVWEMDQRINDRGLHVDLELATKTRSLANMITEGLNEQIHTKTGGAVKTATATKSLLEWVNSQGLKAHSLKKDVVPGLIEKAKGAGLWHVVRALEIRQQASKSSIAKIKRMEERVCNDGRVKGMLLFHGATTGRWTGRGLQPQNLPRGVLTPEEIEKAAKDVLNQDVEALHEMGLPVLEIISSCLRSLFTAKPGHLLIVADFSSIEARILAWLANEGPVLKVFRGDGKVYEHAASHIFGVPVGQVNKEQRSIGKVAVLALGYGGGVNAFKQMASTYDVTISDKKIESVKQNWRKANPRITELWRLLEGAAIRAIKQPGRVFQAGGKISFTVDEGHLWCRLPSGRSICYPYATLKPSTTPWGKPTTKILFKGVDSTTKKWVQQDTYGGKLAENITQAVARDILAESMMRIEEVGHPIVLHVHDEIVCEIKEGSVEVSEFEQLMAETPHWAKDLPLQAEGWTGKRYRK
ncbi:DNA polymerase [Magnetofaba australis]|uniref:DNA-directed DNA polymerase n=1 Tax=Magnetofaba australis IT-1 TaxID=1434232 RepID=A0A1Y2K5R8_9PROT|nr:DNA polymerase [Magnetofaba australis]OSM04333.1 putative DNA-directed DNA polymerase [Magnetofaba australis IT-1]